MPLFFWLSGYNLNLEKERFIEHSFKKIMVPYLKFCCYIFIFRCFLHLFNKDLLSWIKGILEFDTIIYTLGITYKSIFSDYWFLPVLFVAECVIFHIYRKFLVDLKIFYISMFIAIVYGGILSMLKTSVVSPIGIGEAILAMPYIFGGVWYKKRKCQYRKKYLTLIVAILVIGCLYIVVNKLGIISMYNSDIKNLSIFYMVGFGCIYVLITFCHEHNWCNRKNLFSWIGRKSLWIYGLHYIALDVILICDNFFWKKPGELKALVYSIVAIFICIICNCKERSI